MIEVIEKVEGHEIEIFELLFKAIVNYCNDKDTVLLYKKFIHLNLNPTWSIFSLVSKIIKKKTNIKNKKELLSQQTKFKETTNEVIKFRSRTLKTREIDDNILSEDVIFYAYGFCKVCNEYINLMNLCSDLSQLRTKTEGGKDYFKCPNKHQKNNNDYIQLKIGLNFGVELFNLKLKTNKQSTSSNYIIELLSPSTLKKKLLKIAKDLGDNKFNVEMFKQNHKELFWNLVWFFELNNMDISFMLPYSYESCNFINDNQSNEIKEAVKIKYKSEQSIDIEKIVKFTDLNVSIIFYGNVLALQTLGDNIDQETIKNNIFTSLKNKYLSYDLVIQKIFQFEINGKIGMISYMGFNSFSENVGYNEYPVEFREIKVREDSFFSLRSNTKESGLFSLNSYSSSSNINIINKNNSFNLVNKNYSKLKTVSFDNSNTMKGASTFKTLNRGGGLLKNKKQNVSTEIEINKKIEDIDFLTKFKESQKKIESGLRGEKKEEDKSNHNDKLNKLRKSTLKDGILYDDAKDENDEYYDDEGE